jgi:hypothetical protein
MEYRPRGHALKILEGMAGHASDLEWTTEELAGLAGIDKRAVATTMRVAVREEKLFAQKRGRATYYSLTSFEVGDAAPEEDAEPVPFNAALWADGDLVVYGAQANEDGSVTLKRDQVAAVKRLISWVPAP